MKLSNSGNNCRWFPGFRKASQSNGPRPHVEVSRGTEALPSQGRQKLQLQPSPLLETSADGEEISARRQDSARHAAGLPDSSSDESSMNFKAKNLSIDEGRQNRRTSTSPNEKKRSPQDSQSRQGSKRTRHYSDLPSRSPDEKAYPVEYLRNSGDCREPPLSTGPRVDERHILAGREKDKLSQGRATGTEDQGGGDAVDGDIKMLLQPETRPITLEQLINEVKGIYAGLVMVEKKCVEICTQQAASNSKHLTDEQWQALNALHRTLLHEHHDFFLASQHPTASPALKRLATKYAMPARMWRHGIHSFLELLRNRLPHSLDHMLSFVYLAYSMMALLMESVPSFLETWIECLGDLARYRMAIEEADLRDREIWSNVARMWYNKAADLSPNVGRIQHHLAVLARPNIVQQLFYYSKALVSVVPFINARESIMLLFTPFLEKADVTYSKYSVLESSLVTAFGIIFTKGSIRDFNYHAEEFLNTLDGHISRTTVKFKVQGPEIESALFAGILDYGTEENAFWKLIRSHINTLKASQEVSQEGNQVSTTDTKGPGIVAINSVLDPKLKDTLRQKYWDDINQAGDSHTLVVAPIKDEESDKFVTPDDVARHVLPIWSRATSIVASKVGDRNITPYMHLTLAFLWSISFVPGALLSIESYVPWSKITKFLNTLGRSSVSDARVESVEFPDSTSGVGRQLPEDFPIRGLVWAQFLYPDDFFTKNVVDEDERTLELPSHAAPRAERCLWLGARLASLGRYLTYSRETKQFAATEFSLSLTNGHHTLASTSAEGFVENEFDAVMVDVAV